MVLVINDLTEGFQKQLERILPKDTKIFSKDINPIKKCIGCFGCWTKTPGLCLINDASKDINSAIVQNDIFLIISQITYGSFSPYIRNVLDRCIPTLLPFFKKLNNEVHHAPRYDNYPKIVAIGYGDDTTLEEEETFKKLVKANAINLQRTDFEVYTLKNLSDLNTILANIVGGNPNE